jgi:hypothetical protein
MFDIDKTIDAFRRGALDIDCKRMVLTRHKEDGERFEGQGYIRQSDDGALTFKIYVATHNADPYGHFHEMLNGTAGKLHGDEAFYDLEATGHDNTRWMATRILPRANWDATDMTVLVGGRMQSMTAHLDMPQHNHYLRLHFFEEYQVPLLLMSETEEHGGRCYVRDRAEFETCGAKFEVRQRKGTGDTIVELTSETPLPVAFDLRIQEAVQYLTAKSAFWRTRLQSHDKKLHLELASPWRKSVSTQFSPPISPGSSDFHEHGWRLFGAYLAYVTQKTQGTHWNPVAYHLYNACETTANSVDAWAVGISVAVEAVTSLIAAAGNSEQAEKAKPDELTLYQKRVLKWLDEQADLPEHIVKRAKGQIRSMSNKGPKDTLYALTDVGRVEKKYVKAWNDLRNRHVHPKLEDLGKPTPIDMQNLFDHIRKVEVLLRQLTFHLIGYEGPFTDYGADNFPSEQYPLAAEVGSA